MQVSSVLREKSGKNAIFLPFWASKIQDMGWVGFVKGDLKMG